MNNSYVLRTNSGVVYYPLPQIAPYAPYVNPTQGASSIMANNSIKEIATAATEIIREHRNEVLDSMTELDTNEQFQGTIALQQLSKMLCDLDDAYQIAARIANYGD